MLCQHNKHVQKNQSEAFYSTRHQKQKWENKNDQVQGQRIHQKTQPTILYPNWVNKASMLGLEKATTTSFTSCQIIKISHNPWTETKKLPWNFTCMHTQHKFQKKKKKKHYPISLLSEQSFMWLLKALTLIQRPLKLDTDDSPKTSWTKTYDTSVLSLLVFPWSHMNFTSTQILFRKNKFPACRPRHTVHMDDNIHSLFAWICTPQSQTVLEFNNIKNSNHNVCSP